MHLPRTDTSQPPSAVRHPSDGSSTFAAYKTLDPIALVHAARVGPLVLWKPSPVLRNLLVQALAASLLMYALLRSVTSLINETGGRGQQGHNDSDPETERALIRLSSTGPQFLSDHPYPEASKELRASSSWDDEPGSRSLKRANAVKSATVNSKMGTRLRKKSTTSLKSIKSSKGLDDSENQPPVPEVPKNVRPFFHRSPSTPSLGRKRTPLADIFTNNKPPPLPPKDYPRQSVLTPNISASSLAILSDPDSPVIQTPSAILGPTGASDSFPFGQFASTGELSDSHSTVRCHEVDHALQDLDHIEKERRAQKVAFPAGSPIPFPDSSSSLPVSPTSLGFRNLLRMKPRAPSPRETPPADFFALAEPSYFISNTSKRLDLKGIYDFSVYAEPEPAAAAASSPDAQQHGSFDLSFSQESEPETDESKASIETSMLTQDLAWNAAPFPAKLLATKEVRVCFPHAEDGVAAAAASNLAIRRLTQELSPRADGMTRLERRRSSKLNPPSKSNGRRRETLVRPLLLPGLVADRTMTSTTKEYQSSALRQLVLPNRLEQRRPSALDSPPASPRR